MSRLLLLLSLLIGLPSPADATTYYVSEVATNGYVVGADGNNGTAKSTPKLTLANAISTASTGDTIILNDGTYSGTEIGAGGYAVIAKGLTIQAENTGLAILQTSVTTGLVRIQGPAAATYVFTGIVFDGLGSSAVPNYTFWIDDTTGLYTVTLTDCTFTNATFYFIYVPANEVALTITNATFSASSAVTTRSLLHAVALAEGSITINGATGTIAKHATASNGLINIKATVAGVTASVSGVTATITLDPSLSSTGEHFGVQILNIADALIQNNAITITGAPGSRTGAIYRISADAAISSINGRIINNTGSNLTNGGYGAIIGADGTSAGDNQTNNGLIYGNILTGSNAATHGAMLGFNRGGQVRMNTLIDMGIAAISKQQTVSGGVGPSIFQANVILNPKANGLRCKGSAQTIFAQNTVYWSGTAPTYGMLIDSDSATHCTSIAVQNNSMNALGAIAILGQVSTNSDAAFNNNHWYTDQALPANAWVYTSTSYASLANWEAAAHATNEIGGDPLFVSRTTYDFRTAASSPLRNAGIWWSNSCVDRRGRPCFPGQIDIGAYQKSSGDPASSRNVRE